MKKNILDEIALKEYLKKNNIPDFKCKQVFHEIFKNQNINWEEMTTLSKDLRQDLVKEFNVLALKSDKILEDKETTKIAFKTYDGHIVESVIIYHWKKEKYCISSAINEDLETIPLTSFAKEGVLNRITLCVSSQIGCPANCIFCVTGKLGFTRNLTSDEIISQILFANNYIKKKFGKKEDKTLYSVRNVVFMGMGEPLMNYNNVKRSVEIMLQQNRFSLSRRHVTISTAGIVPGIKSMIDDELNVKLAISLHAPNQVLREKLMPIAKQYHLDELMDVLATYVHTTDNRLFYEYIMIKELNDTPEIALELSYLLRGQLCHINLIPYNSNPAIDLEESSRNRIHKFKKILEENGLTVTIRDSMGRNFKSACGQLGYEKVSQKHSND